MRRHDKKDGTAMTLYFVNDQTKETTFRPPDGLVVRSSLDLSREDSAKQSAELKAMIDKREARDEARKASSKEANRFLAKLGVGIVKALVYSGNN